MKKTVYSLTLCLVLSSNVFALDDSLRSINSGIKTMLVPFQNPNTLAKFKFHTLDRDQGFHFALSALYSKSGSKNKFKLDVNHMSFLVKALKDGSYVTPVSCSLKASLETDFTKLLTQEEVKAMIPKTIQVLEETVKNQSEKYGDALFIKNQILSSTKNEEGNYSELNTVLAAKLDYDNESTSFIADAPFSELFFSLRINVKTGLSINTYAVLNPKYSQGWKISFLISNLITGFLSHHPESLNQLRQFVTFLDSKASRLTETSDELLSNVMSL